MGGSKRVWVRLVFLLIFSEIGRWSEGCLEQERSALIQIKHSFNSSFWPEEGDGKNYSDCCQWRGVECSTITGRVKALNLSDPTGVRHLSIGERTGLRGPVLPIEGEWYLNASLFTPFKQLEILDLRYNQIAGCIKNEGLERLSKLSNLKSLDLGYNLFDNTVLLSLSDLSSLKYLYLNDNRLKGTIDVKEFASLINLEELHMNRNCFDKFVAPRGLNKLKFLDLSSNNHGIVTAQEEQGRPYTNRNLCSNGSLYVQGICKLAHLQKLYISNSDLRGSLPWCMANMTSLHVIDVSSNQLTGSIPSGLCELVYLQELIIQGLCELVHLQEFRMDNNDIRGSLPCCMENMTSLQIFGVSSNQLNGNISSGLCELVHLREFLIDHNDVRESLPRCLSNMTSLQVLDVSFNQLTENFSSSSIMFPTSFQELRLSNNHFQIPLSLEPFLNLSKLKIFQGDSNQIYAESESHLSTPKFQLTNIALSGYGNGGTFPKFLYHQHELEYVDLSHINLTGEFPNWLLENNSKLSHLLLANNSLSGYL